MKDIEVPAAIRSKSPGTLVPLVVRAQMELFLRDSEWSVKRYPAACPVELRLGTWEIDKVLLVALVVRLARSDGATFDCEINVRTPTGMRMLQCLGGQSQIDIHLVGDQTVRTLRAHNPAAVAAGYLIDNVRSRAPWTTEEGDHALDRLNTLYPTSHDLWWACTREKKP